MDLEEIRRRKSRMEENIQQAVMHHIDEFSLVTGVRIESITINMIETTTFGDIKNKFTIGQVNVDLERI